MTTRQQVAAATLEAPRLGAAGPVRALGRIEVRRMARHPMFLFGTALGIVFTLFDGSGGIKSAMLGIVQVPLFVGLAAIIASLHITRSFHGAEELVESTPTTTTQRGAALCAMALVPMVASSAWLVFNYGFLEWYVDTPEVLYGTLSRAETAMVLVGHTIIATLGATLLGIAAGRWWRFRGATVLLVVLVFFWTTSMIGSVSNAGAAAPWERWVRLFTPFTTFTSLAPGTEHNSEPMVDTLTGSVWWYHVWLLTLCALAAVAVLLWRAEGETRKRVIRAGGAILAVSAVTYLLAAGGGLSEVVRTYPDGHTIVLRP
jgi:hypothetical protein